MSLKYSQTEIFEYWTRQASEFKQSPSASWSDHHVIELEIREITKRLADGDKVLDVGCANGYSTLRFAAARDIQIRGLDYIPEMIEQARLRCTAVDQKIRRSIEFAVGDITDLKEPSSCYDKVIAIRVLINLGNMDNQVRGLRECIRVLKPGGVLLLSEATVQGWRRLNLLRSEWGLDDIPMPAFNTYLDEDEVVLAARQDLDLLEISNFASSYYVSTRLVKPLLARISSAPIDVANPSSEWNRWSSLLPPAGDYGTQKLFVFRKRQSELL
jgi:ubiquinone/menaquinone biosynthesis C-methylase UbiE